MEINVRAVQRMLESASQCRYLRWAEHGAMLFLGAVALNTLLTAPGSGTQALMRDIIALLRRFPGVNALVSRVLRGEVEGAMSMLAVTGKDGDDSNDHPLVPIPKDGTNKDELLALMEQMHSQEAHTETGHAFAFAYVSDRHMPEHGTLLGEAFTRFAEGTGLAPLDKGAQDALCNEVYRGFIHTNALNPLMFPSLRRFETEIVSMTAWMLNGDAEAVGTLTSGGTESILCAIKCYRDRARSLRPDITTPNMVVPTTIHPAFEKASHYFGVDIVHVPVDENYRADVPAMAQAIDHNTILMVVSAPQYCHGVVDPVEAASQVALAHGLPLHVDACFGGFMLPWLEKLGEPIPRWDFRVPGVSSISADVHKYGYASKGASVIVYRNSELRKHQFFAYSEWPGGLFGSPSLMGSRPGGAIASAWAAMRSLGQEGYLRVAREVLNSTKKIVKRVKEIEGIGVAAEPDMTCLAIVSEDPSLDILAVADVMEERGWKMERQQLPPSLHCSIMPQHTISVDQLLVDLEECVDMVRTKKQVAEEGSAAVYGMAANIPDKSLVDDFIVQLFGEIFRTTAESKASL